MKQAERYGVEMLQAISVTRISADSGMTADGDELDVETATGDHYHARAVLVATGSSYRRTGADGEDDLIGAGIHFCATCDGPFYKGSDELMVIGGGNSGLEEGSSSPSSPARSRSWSGGSAPRIADPADQGPGSSHTWRSSCSTA